MCVHADGIIDLNYLFDRFFVGFGLMLIFFEISMGLHNVWCLATTTHLSHDDTTFEFLSFVFFNSTFEFLSQSTQINDYSFRYLTKPAKFVTNTNNKLFTTFVNFNRSRCEMIDKWQTHNWNCRLNFVWKSDHRVKLQNNYFEVEQTF